MRLWPLDILSTNTLHWAIVRQYLTLHASAPEPLALRRVSLMRGREVWCSARHTQLATALGLLIIKYDSWVQVVQPEGLSGSDVPDSKLDAWLLSGGTFSIGRTEYGVPLRFIVRLSKTMKHKMPYTPQEIHQSGPVRYSDSRGVVFEASPALDLPLYSTRSRVVEKPTHVEDKDVWLWDYTEEAQGESIAEALDSLKALKGDVL